MNGKIYILTDKTGIRYVGQTSKTLDFRLNQHIRSVKFENNYKRNWVISLLNRNERPNIILVEDNIPNLELLNEAEIFYIAKFKELGCKLVNSSLGGRFGNVGFMKKGMFFGKRLEKGYTQSENTKRLKSLNNPLRREIYQLDLDGNIIAEFNSQHEEARVLNLNQGNIGMVLSGRRKTTGGFIFKYKKENK